jgi:hypothetical protein
VQYDALSQLSHRSLEAFVLDLQKVWKNVRAVSCDNGRLIVRFGGINERECEPRALIGKSLKDTGWSIQTIKSAGTASHGRRQANSFGENRNAPIEEIDVWCRAM